MAGPPGREPQLAQSRDRRSFTVHGTVTTIEKDGVGLFFDDIFHTFADISVVSLPLLWYIMVTSPVEYGGVKSAAFVGWMTMVLGAAVIRGSWVTPPFTEIPGWVSLTPLLVGVRVLYFNLTVTVAAYGGAFLGTRVQTPGMVVVWALIVGVIAVGVFPSMAGAIARRW